MKILKWLVGVVLIVLLAIVATVFLPAGKELSMPSPNGYDVLQEAMSLLAPRPETREMDEGELSDYVSNNQNALEKAREALELESRVTIIPDDVNGMKKSAERSLVKSLYSAFAAEGKLAEMQDQPAEALRSYIDALKVGLVSSKGGTMMDRLIGIAAEATGLDKLEIRLNELTLEDCHFVLGELGYIDRNTDTVEQVFQQEKNWVRATQPLRLRIMDSVLRMLPNSPYKPLEANFESKSFQHSLRMRTFLVKVATRAYELENGSPPESIEDIVSEYLDEVPVDPVTEVPMKLL